MNVSELARRLKVSPQELYNLLPEFGFDIGRRAIKVDDRVAAQIIDVWPAKYRSWLEKQRRAGAPEEAAALTPAGTEAKIVQLPRAITVRELAAKLNLPVTNLIRELIKNGILATINDRIDYETASIMASDLGFQVETEKETVGEAGATVDKLQVILEGEAKERLVSRPPVIVVMGHVDHGKTKILDKIRTTKVAEGEAGGITQHIGAYQVKVGDRSLTFIDTPGHEAFTVMRSRGAKVADIAILVVAADDGVQPQTKEAVKIIQAAKLPFVAAINKIDKPEADQQRVKTQLSELGLIPEEWGGKTICTSVSAKTGEGIDKLLEVLILVADMEKERIMANPNRLAVGTIIESHIDKGEGAVATVLVQSGTLRLNEPLAINNVLYGRVRAMRNWQGESLTAAPPGTPVKIIGFKAAPVIGDILEVPADIRGLEKKVRGASSARAVAAAVAPAAAPAPSPEKKLLNIIIRADVLGSLEVILGSLEKFAHSEVGVTVIAKGLGSITETEVMRAATSEAIVYGFNVPVLPAAELLAREKNVSIRQYKIIYDLLDDVKNGLQKLMPPEVLTEEMARFQVLAVFRIEKNYAIIGGRVSDGKITAGLKARVVRNKEKVGEGTIEQAQVGKQAVNEVVHGQECGLKIKTKDKIEVGDNLEIYREEIKERKLTFSA